MTTTPNDVLIRPMRDEDVPLVERLSSSTFLELDQRTAPPLLARARGAVAGARGEVGRADPPTAGHRRRRVLGGRARVGRRRGARRLRDLDDPRADVGAVQLRRPARAPGPRHRPRSCSRPRSHHGRGCLRAMLSASRDPLAVRRYHQAGFTLHPQMYLTGPVDRSVLPVVEKTREGSAGDLDLMNSVDRADPWRRAPRRPRAAARAVPPRRSPTRPPAPATCTSTGSARRSCWPRPTGAPPPGCSGRRWPSSDPLVNVDIPHVTPANAWAVDVGMAARMELYTSGYLALRGMKPPAPYLHHGSLL